MTTKKSSRIKVGNKVAYSSRAHWVQTQDQKSAYVLNPMDWISGLIKHWNISFQWLLGWLGWAPRCALPSWSCTDGKVCKSFYCLVTSATHIQAEDEPRELDFKTKLQRTLELQNKLHEQENENIEKTQACQKKQEQTTPGTLSEVRRVENLSHWIYTVVEDISKGWYQ